MEELSGDFGAIRRSLLSRVQVVRVFSNWLRARMLLAAAAETGDRSQTNAAAALSRRLGREGVSYGRVYALLLDASIACQRGDRETGLRALRQAAHTAGEGDMALYAAAATYCAGVIEQGERGQERCRAAADEMQELGIREPARMVEVVVSGLLGALQ